MKYKKLSLILLVLVLVVGFLFFYYGEVLNFRPARTLLSVIGFCVIESGGNTTSVPVDVAQTFAMKQVTSNNEPYVWKNVGYYLIYGSDKKINFYAFVFRKETASQFDTMQKIELNASKYDDYSQEGSENKYQFSNIATVITGATQGQELLIRHFRGVQEIIGKKIEIKNYVEKNYPGKTIDRIVQDTSMGKLYFEIVDAESKIPSGDLIDVNYKTEPQKSVLKSIIYNKARNIIRSLTIPKDRCGLLKDAYSERESYLKQRWEAIN